jgi:UDP-N-acetylmuramate dehydrogenase
LTTDERAQLVIEERVPLSPRTTLELGGQARYFVRAEHEHTVVAALRWAQERSLPVAILGGGSNLVVSDAGFDGLVIAIALRGVHSRVRGACVEIEAAAGEPWDALVAHCVERDLAGVECLSGIPGLVGATPIQNVGAYGQEVAQVISSVRVLERGALQPHTLGPEQCGFAYRDSAFKRNPERCVVLSVSFALRLSGEPSALAYAELARALELRAGGAAASLQQVRATVLELRRAKSMLLDADDDNRRSAGSFFLNPIVTAEHADRVAQTAVAAGLIAGPGELPRHPAPDGKVKLAAAWLIERAGLHKGERRGAVGISTRHALALVHHGGGSSAELLAFAREIQARVRQRFGVALELEPVLLGSW